MSQTTSTAGPAVGDTVYIFNENRRVYERDETGRASGGPIYREHFQPYIIQGEEKRSWIVVAENGSLPQKIAKDRFRTAAQVDDACWWHVHRVRIADAVRSCRDVSCLREIARIIGYHGSST